MLGIAGELGDGGIKKEMKLGFAFWSKGNFHRYPIDRERCRGSVLRLLLGGPPGAAAVCQRKYGGQRIGFPGNFPGEILDVDFIHRAAKLGRVRMLRRSREGLRAERLCFRGKVHFEAAFRIER